MKLNFAKKIYEGELVKDICLIIAFMKKTGVRLKFFVISLFFSLTLTLFNLYTVALLLPLAQGIINQDFNHVKNIKILGWVANGFPNIFNSSLRLFVLLVGWVYLNIIIKNIFKYVSSVTTGNQARKATAKMRDLLFDKCLSFGKSFYDKNKISQVYNVVTKSSDVIESQFRSLQGIMVEVFLVLMYLILMFKISWKLMIVVVVSFPIISLFTKRLVRKIALTIRKKEQTTIDLNNKIYNVLNYSTLIKGFAKEDYERGEYNILSNKEIDEYYKIQKISSLFAPIQDIAMNTSALLLALGMVVVIYFDKGLSPANAFVFFYLAQNFSNRIGAFQGFKLGILQSSRPVEDINALLNDNEKYVIESGGKEFSGFKKEIEIRNLNFSYGETEEKVLKNINLYIKKGEKIAIVGPTGSGKSTLSNLLLRIYDCPAGTIFIDDEDIRHFNLKDLRKRMSFVFQDSLILNDTVMKNISYGSNEEVSNELVLDVSKKVAVHDFVDRMSDKYNTVVGERGSMLSGGEKQRISVARALLRDADILFMDEATSALDYETEARVMSAVNEFFSDKTIITIAHRLSVVKNVDRIIFMQDGEVKECGTIDELISLNGLFYKHWSAQKIS